MTALSAGSQQATTTNIFAESAQRGTSTRMKPSPHTLDARRSSAPGPMRTFPLSCFAGSGGAPACRVPPRRAGNFHLRGQMKVTKAQALNAPPLMRSSRFGAAPGGPLEAPLRPGLPARSQARASPGLARAIQTLDARPKREARPTQRAWWHESQQGIQWPAGRGFAACRTSEWFCIEPLCFGDFHLGPQMKVTRPPGRDPACNAGHPMAPKQDKRNFRNGPKAAQCTTACHASRVARSAVEQLT